MTTAHEAKLQDDRDPEDTEVDMINNATAIRMASSPQYENYSCDQIADEAMNLGTAAYK